MLSHEISNDRLIALVLIGVLALNYPLLYLFSDVSLFFGIPVLYLYLFIVWGAFIFLATLIVGSKAKKGKASVQQSERV